MTIPLGLHGAEDTDFFNNIRRYAGQAGTYFGRWEDLDPEVSLHVGDLVRTDHDGGSSGDTILYQALQDDPQSINPLNDDAFVYWQPVTWPVIMKIDDSVAADSPATASFRSWQASVNLQVEGTLTSGQYQIGTTDNGSTGTIQFDADGTAVQGAVITMLDAGSAPGGPWNTDTTTVSSEGSAVEGFSVFRIDDHFIPWELTFDADTLEVDGDPYPAEDVVITTDSNGVVGGVPAEIGSAVLGGDSLWFKTNTGIDTWVEVSIPNDDTWHDADIDAYGANLFQGIGALALNGSSEVLFQVKRQKNNTGNYVVNFRGYLSFSDASAGDDDSHIAMPVLDLPRVSELMAEGTEIDQVWGTAYMTDAGTMLGIQKNSTGTVALFSPVNGLDTFGAIVADDELWFEFWCTMKPGD